MPHQDLDRASPSMTETPEPGVRTFGIAGPSAQNAVKWLKLLGGLGLAQGVVQGLAFLAGIVVIRALAPGEYAIYTLAYSVLGAMNVLADGGISNGMMAEAGKAWTEPRKLGAVVVAGLKLRWIFGTTALALTLPFLIYSLHAHDASWLVAALLAAIVAASFIGNLVSAVYTVVLSVHQRVADLQRVIIMQNLGRLGLLGAMLFLLPGALAAAFATLPGQIWAAFRLRRLARPLAEPGAADDPVIRAGIFRVVARTWPGSAYYAVSGQITIWLISLFGSTTALAQIGALSRLGQILGVLSTIMTVLLLPRFARLPNERGLLARRFFQVLLFAGAVGAAIVTLVALFPAQSLWLLGRDYNHLTHEVILQAAGSVISLLAGTAFGLGSVRGLVLHPAISIPLELLLQVALIQILDVGVVSGALWFGIWLPLGSLTMHLVYLLVCGSRIPRQSAG